MKLSNSRRAALLLLLAIVFVAAGCGKTNQANIKLPSQPFGLLPGGSEVKNSGLTQNKYGSGDTAYWIFEPADPKPATAPVIVFNHGWGAINPAPYGGWIEHLVKRGNIVIYPVYQESFKADTHAVTNNAIAGVKAAITELQKGGSHVKPDLSKFAIVGHSAGGLITANMAALAKSKGLPKATAVMSVEPGKTWTRSEKTQIPLSDLSLIPAETLLIAMVGQDDRVVKDIDAKRIFKESTKVPAENKNFIILQSDNHGAEELNANHFAPNSFGEVIKASATAGSDRPLLQMIKERRASMGISEGDEEGDQSLADGESAGSKSVNAHDYFGFWKVLDGLTDAAFYAKNRQYALGNSRELTFMGTWSDGVDIKPLLIVTNP